MIPKYVVILNQVVKNYHGRPGVEMYICNWFCEFEAVCMWRDGATGLNNTCTNE